MTEKNSLVPTTGSPTSPMAVRYNSTVWSKMDPAQFINSVGMSLFNGRMCGVTSIDEGKIVALHMFINRIDPALFEMRNHIIQGKISLKAETMLADFRAKYGGRHKIIERSPERAEIELIETGEKKGVRFSCTFKEAVDAGFVWLSNEKLKQLGNPPKFLEDGTPNAKAMKDNWAHPRGRMQMLWARVISDGVGAVCPEVTCGALCPEELDEIPQTVLAEENEIIDAEFTMNDSFKPTTAPVILDTTPVSNTADSRESLYLTLKGLKIEAIQCGALTDEQYKSILLDNFNADSAVELTNEELNKLIDSIGSTINAKLEDKRKSEELAKNSPF